MAEFQASLIDPTTQEASISVDADCSQLQVKDSSNYTQFNKITGTVAVTNGSLTVTGTGTLFTTELVIGNKISINGTIFTVSGIASNVSLTLSGVYPGVSAVGLDIFLNEQEGGHDASDFSDFIKIIVQEQGGSSYIFTNFINPSTGLLDGDEVITTPNIGPTNITVNYNITTGDGVYGITLCVVPTYNAADNYAINIDYVFYDNKFYKSIRSSIGKQPDTSASDWAEVTLDKVSAKYCTFENVVVVCELNKCVQDATLEAFCTLKEYVCDDDVLCKNERFLKAMKLFVVRESITNANTRGAFKDIKDMISLSKTLCGCC